MSVRQTVSDRACEHLDRISGSDPCRVIIMDLLDEISRLSGLAESMGIAIASEREACAKIADEWGTRQDQMTDTAFIPGADHGERFASEGIAASIRARRP